MHLTLSTTSTSTSTFASDFLETISTIYWSVPGWLEGYFCFLATLRARRVMHWALV